MRNIQVKLLWEPRDLWVGLFWDRREVINERKMRSEGTKLHLYFCLIPTIVLRVIV